MLHLHTDVCIRRWDAAELFAEKMHAQRKSEYHSSPRGPLPSANIPTA